MPTSQPEEKSEEWRYFNGLGKQHLKDHNWDSIDVGIFQAAAKWGFKEILGRREAEDFDIFNNQLQPQHQDKLHSHADTI